MRYRRKVLQDRLKELEHLVTGRGESYLPFISNEKGKVTEEKTEQFISEMLGAFQRYIKFNPRRTLSGETLEMYESFLYCAILSLGMEHSRRDYKVINWRISSVFEDIVNRAEKVEIVGCNSYDRYLEDCCRAYHAACDIRDEHQRKIWNDPNPALRNMVADLGSTLPETDSDFFIGVKRSIEFLGYPPFMECFPEETLCKLRKGYDQKETLSERKTETAALSVTAEAQSNSAAEYDEAAVENAMHEYLVKLAQKQEQNEQIDEAIDSLREDETYSDNKALSGFTVEEVRKREQDKADDELLAVKSEWKQRIVFDEETLYQNFQRFLRLYFDSPDRRYFVEDIRNMVDTFLYEHRISIFSLGDDYGMINYYIDRTKNRIEREIEREIERGKRK